MENFMTKTIGRKIDFEYYSLDDKEKIDFFASHGYLPNTTDPSEKFKPSKDLDFERFMYLPSKLRDVTGASSKAFVRVKADTIPDYDKLTTKSAYVTYLDGVKKQDRPKNISCLLKRTFFPYSAFEEAASRSLNALDIPTVFNSLVADPFSGEPSTCLSVDCVKQNEQIYSLLDLTNYDCSILEPLSYWHKILDYALLRQQAQQADGYDVANKLDEKSVKAIKSALCEQYFAQLYLLNNLDYSAFNACIICKTETQNGITTTHSPRLGPAMDFESCASLLFDEAETSGNIESVNIIDAQERFKSGLGENIRYFLSEYHTEAEKFLSCLKTCINENKLARLAPTGDDEVNLTLRQFYTLINNNCKELCASIEKEKALMELGIENE